MAASTHPGIQSTCLFLPVQEPEYNLDHAKRRVMGTSQFLRAADINRASFCLFNMTTAYPIKSEAISISNAKLPPVGLVTSKLVPPTDIELNDYDELKCPVSKKSKVDVAELLLQQRNVLTPENFDKQLGMYVGELECCTHTQNNHVLAYNYYVSQIGIEYTSMHYVIEHSVVNRRYLAKPCLACVRCLDAVMPRECNRLRLRMVRLLDRLRDLGALQHQQVLDVVSILFPFYLAPHTPGATNQVNLLSEKIVADVNRCEIEGVNYLRLVALSTHKFQINCRINQEDWSLLTPAEQMFCEKVYVWARLNLDYIGTNALFTSMIDNCQDGKLIWGLGYKSPGGMYAVLFTGSSTVVCAEINIIVKDLILSSTVMTIIASIVPRCIALFIATGFDYLPLPLDNPAVVAKRNSFATYHVRVKQKYIRMLKDCIAINNLKELNQNLYLINRLYPVSSEVDFKFTTMHPHNVIAALLIGNHSLSSAEQTMSDEDRLKYVLSVIERYPIGWSSHNFTAQLLGGFANRLGTKRRRYEEANRLYYLSWENYTKIAKEVSTDIRAYQVLPDGTPLDFFDRCFSVGWEIGNGRFTNHSDVAKEEKNRCIRKHHLSTSACVDGDFLLPEDGVWGYMQEDPEFKQLHAALATNCAKSLLSRKASKQSFLDYLSHRQDWVSSGSANDADVVLDGIKHRGSKRVWAEGFTAKDKLAELKAMPIVEIANGSEKFEVDKARALYAPSVDNFLINSYALVGVEHNLQNIIGVEKAISGLALLSCEVRRARLSGYESTNCTCADYADFNKAHTPDSMKSIFDGLSAVAKENNSHPDYLWATNYVAQSQHFRMINFKGFACGDPRLRRVVQGMFSGTRGTDVINTVQNVIYEGIAKIKVNQLYALKPIDEYSIHQGDDFWQCNRNTAYAVALLLVIKKMGLELQTRKQLLTCDTSEFLRIQYSQGCASGLLFRAVCNALLKPLQSKKIFDPEGNVKAIVNNLSVMVRRKMSIESVCAMWYFYTCRYRVLYRSEADTHPLVVPWIVICGNQLCGGYGAIPPGYAVSVPVKLSPVPKAKKFTEDLNRNDVAQGMTKDWVAYLVRKSGEKCLDTESLHRIGVVANYAGVLEDHAVNTRNSMLIDEWIVWNAQNSQLSNLQLDGILVSVSSWQQLCDITITNLEVVYDCVGLNIWNYAVQQQVDSQVDLMLLKLDESLHKTLKRNQLFGIMTQLFSVVGKTPFKSFSNLLTAFHGEPELAICYLKNQLLTLLTALRFQYKEEETILQEFRLP